MNRINIGKLGSPIILALIAVLIGYASLAAVDGAIYVKTQDGVLNVPEHFPPAPFPTDNPYTKEKAELGRWLFYEKLLSRDSTMSCGHCMKQEHAFSHGGVKFSKGFNREPEMRNTMSLMNSVYRNKLFWDGRGKRIEQPAYRSIFLPKIFASDTNEINVRLQNHERYPKMFERAFGPGVKPSVHLAAMAISTFVRTFISGNSPYDRYIQGDKNALTAEQIEGMNLFFSDRTNCSKCHAGINFTNLDFHNTGTTTHYFDRGRFYITNEFTDRGRFITPTLRNVEVTYPYTHNAEFDTLEEVIENYNIGGQKFINKDTLIKPLNLSFAEKKALVAFLKALTDREFLENPIFSDPHKKENRAEK